MATIFKQSFMCCIMLLSFSLGGVENDLYDKFMNVAQEFCDKECAQKTTVHTLLSIMRDYTQTFAKMSADEAYEFKASLNDYLYERFREHQKEVQEGKIQNRKDCGLIFVAEFVHTKILIHYTFDQVLAFFVVVGLSEQFLTLNRS